MIEFSNVSITTDFGEYIRDPALQSKEITRLENITDIYGTDIRMLGTGELFVFRKDISIVSGIPNLAQAITHRLMTERGHHPMDITLGIPWSEYLGQTYTDSSIVLARLSSEIVDELLKEERILDVENIEASFTALNVISLSVTIIPIENNATFNISLDIRDR